MLRLHYGRARVLFPAMAAELNARRGKTHYIIVPKQLTLLTERRLLSALNLRGSFDLQVISCERLCDRIFEAAGRPEGDHVDDLGRVMLTRLAVKQTKNALSLYRDAHHRFTFPQRAAEQIMVFRQAGITPDALRAFAAREEISNLLSQKLKDLAAIQEAYEALLEGRYLDGEATFAKAALAARSAEFLRESNLWFYGFDMMPPGMQSLIAHLGAACEEAHLFIPAEPDRDAVDADCYDPLYDSMYLLRKIAQSVGTPLAPNALHEEEAFALPPRPDALHVLEHHLYADSPARKIRADGAVRLIQMRTAAEECAYAAATVRDLVRRNGWRYRDIQILCADTQGYSALLRSAFNAYGIPLVLADARSALRNGMAEGLVCSLRVLDRGYPSEDMRVLLRSGLFEMDDDDRDALENYTIRYSLRGKKWTQPLTRGKDEEIARVEPLRAQMMEPLLALKEALKAAADLPAQLEAIYNYLDALEVCPRIDAHMKQLSQMDMWETAGEEGQVWNRIIGTLDQICALMGSEKLALRELYEILQQSLGAAVIKALPQSDDSVYAQGMKVLCPQPVKALLVLGVADVQTGGANALLSDEQRRLLSALSKAYLGPEETDLARLNRYYLKSSIGMATDFVLMSCALSGPGGEAQKPSLLFPMVEALFEDVPVLGGVYADEETRRMMLTAPRPVINEAALGLAQLADDETAHLSALQQACIASIALRAENDVSMATALSMLKSGVRRRNGAASIDPETARALYGRLEKLSISQLEMFASCPFRYFLGRGIRPDIVRPYEFMPADEGTFLHECARLFVEYNRGALNDMDEDEARTRMGAVADKVLDRLEKELILGDTGMQTAIRRSLREKAREGAAAIVRQMHGSAFANTDTEFTFGSNAKEPTLSIGADGRLHGIIDRIDAWNGYLRVIDYKRGEKSLSLSEVNEGLSLQLPLYLAAARKLRGAQSAGVFYFTFNDGIVKTDSVNPAEIAAERKKAFKLTGLYSAQSNVTQALSPEPPKEFYRSGVAASPEDFDNVERCAIEKARESFARIRSGECSAAPFGEKPCEYCDHADVCMFNRGKARAVPPAKNDEMLRILAERYETDKTKN